MRPIFILITLISLVVLQKGAVSLLTTEVESYSTLLQQLNNLNFLESPAL